MKKLFRNIFFTNVEGTEISFSFSVFASIDMTTKVVYPKYYNTDYIFWQLHFQKVPFKEKNYSFLIFLTNFLVRTLQYTENLFYICFPHDNKGKSQISEVFSTGRPISLKSIKMYLSIYITWDI